MSAPFALTGATLIDGRGGPPVHDAVVVVAGERIRAAGARAAVAIPADATLVDLAGKFVLPGLIDAHVHIGTSGGGNADPAEFRPSTLAAVLQSFLLFGVTSIMDMGGHPHLENIRTRLRTRELIGPRLFGVKYGITAPESHPIGLLREFGAMEKIGSHFLQVDDPGTAREMVRRVAAEHPDGLKIYHSRTEFPGTMCLDCNREKLKPDVLAALVDEGHAHGLRVFAHIAYPSEAADVVAAGVDVLAHPITHAESGADRVTAAMAERRVMVHSTMTRVEAYFGLRVDPFLRDKLRGKVPDVVLDGLGLPRSVVLARHEGSGVSADAQRILATTMANVRRALTAGVTIVMGTDSGGAGGFHGASVMRELELLNACGLSPMQAIESATRHAATSVGQPHELGTVEAGKLADLIVVDDDPLRDIRNVNHLSLVVKNGERIDPAALRLPTAR